MRTVLAARALNALKCISSTTAGVLNVAAMAATGANVDRRRLFVCLIGLVYSAWLEWLGGRKGLGMWNGRHFGERQLPF